MFVLLFVHLINLMDPFPQPLNTEFMLPNKAQDWKCEVTESRNNIGWTQTLCLGATVNTNNVWMTFLKKILAGTSTTVSTESP